MAVQVTSITHQHELVTGTIPNITGNVFDKIVTTIQFHTQKLVDATIDNEIEFAPDGYGSLDYIEMVNGGGDFADFQIGDPIVVFGGVNAGTYTIIGKPDNSTIQVNASLTASVANNVIIYVNYVQNACEFSYGLVENSEIPNYLSKVDGNEQMFKHDLISASFTDMTPVGSSKGWLLGKSEIKTRTMPLSWQFGFEIKHTHYINPFFLFTQTTTSPPNYLLDSNSLRYVFKLKVKPFTSYTAGINEGEFTIYDGNTGWFNEVCNNNLTNYSVSNLTYTKVSDLSSLTGVMLTDTDETRVKFRITNNTTTPFVNGSTKFCVHIINVPFSTDDYQNTSTDLGQNFTYDRALQTVGSGAINGEFSRCVNGVTGTFINNANIDVEFDVQYLLADKTRIFGYDTRKFLIAVSICDHAKNINLTDVTTLLVDYNEFGVLLGTDNAASSTVWNLYDHPFYVSQAQIADTDCFLEDELFSVQRVKIDTTNSVYEPTLISFECGVQLKNVNTNAIVELDSINLDVSSAPIINGLAFVNQTVQRGFKVPSTDLLKRLKITRNIPLDAANQWYYDIEFPFLIGWEYWQANPLIPNDFFDIAEPNNGLNNSWHRFKLNLDFLVQLFTNVIIRFNGVDYLYNLTNNIVVNNYLDNPDWDNENIKSYDSTSTDITNNILGFEQTKVIAQYDWVGAGAAPDITEVDWVLRLEPKENGGRNISTRFSSVYAMTSDTQWLSSDTSNKIIKTKVGNTYYAEALIDNTTLQDFNEFDITSRIYDLRAGSLCAVDNLLSEAGDCFITEGGDNLIQE